MTAENCISQAKIYATQMCHMKTLQDRFKDQQLIPLIIHGFFDEVTAD